MEADFWHQRWGSDQIAFHLTEVNPNLREHWPRVGLTDGHVFVPLCGKSLDLAWLAQRGYAVSGVELSAIAVRDFFAEHGLAPERDRIGGFERYRAGGITLLCGDFFALRGADLARIDAVYDRAALIALPGAQRERYAAHLAWLTPAGVAVLLVTLEYRQQEMAGPPFAVHADEIERLFAATFEVSEIAASGPLEVPPGLAERGLRAMRERVYVLRRR